MFGEPSSGTTNNSGIDATNTTNTALKTNPSEVSDVERGMATKNVKDDVQDEKDESEENQTLYSAKSGNSSVSNSTRTRKYSLQGALKKLFGGRKASISKSASNDSLNKVADESASKKGTKEETSSSQIFEGKLSAEVLKMHDRRQLGDEGPVLTPSILPPHAKGADISTARYAWDNKPVTDVEKQVISNLEEKPVRRRYKDFTVSCSYHTKQGFYHENEDRLIAKMDTYNDKERPTHLFGVFDGHGGQGCCSFVENNCKSIFVESPSPGVSNSDNPKDSRKLLLRALAACSMKMEYEFCRHAIPIKDNSGACSLICAVHDNYLAFASIGDCEMILVSAFGTRVKRMNHPHRSSGEKERKRIEKAGGYVINGRAMGVLEPSRTLGDIDVKKLCPGAVIASPEVGIVDLKEMLSEDEASASLSQMVGTPVNQSGPGIFCILATDGVFDVMDEFEAASHVSRSFTYRNSRKIAAEKLCEHAKKLGSRDDITAIVIGFQERNKTSF